MFASLFGCMTAEKHFQKFLDKGGVVNCKQDSVLVTDTLFLIMIFRKLIFLMKFLLVNKLCVIKRNKREKHQQKK